MFKRKVCKECQTKGFFLKLTEEGYCKHCQDIVDYRRYEEARNKAAVRFEAQLRKEAEEQKLRTVVTKPNIDNHKSVRTELKRSNEYKRRLEEENRTLRRRVDEEETKRRRAEEDAEGNTLDTLVKVAVVSEILHHSHDHETRQSHDDSQFFKGGSSGGGGASGSFDTPERQDDPDPPSDDYDSSGGDDD